MCIHWEKVGLRVPAVLLLIASLLFWGRYDRYARVGEPLLESPALADAAFARGASVAADDRFVLVVKEGDKASVVSFDVEGLKGGDLVRVRGRIRTDEVVTGKFEWNCARLILIQRDANKKWIPVSHGVGMESGTRPWSACEEVFEVDGRAATVQLSMRNGGVSGTVEFDRILVEKVRLRCSYAGWVVFFAVAWIFMAVVYFRRCRLDRRRLRVLILLNALVIVIGTLMPERGLEEIAEQADTVAVRVLTAVEKKAPEKGAPVSVSEEKGSGKRSSEEKQVDEFNKRVGGVHGVGHFLLFASLCYLVYLSAALERQHRIYYLKVMLDILLFAAITESLQYLTMDRTPGWSDFRTDVFGMVLAFLMFLLTGWVFVRGKKAG